jgi:hypothetical protein
MEIGPVLHPAPACPLSISLTHTLSLSLSLSQQAELAAQWLALDGGVKAEVRRLLLSTLGSQVWERT